MAYSNLAGVCPAILAGLGAVTNNAFSRLMTPVGFVQALVDPENTRGVQIIQQAGGEEGGVRQVRVVYKQRGLPSEIEDEKTCDPGEEKPRFEEIYTLALEKHHTIHVKEATLRTLCDGFAAYQSVPVNRRDSDGKAVNSLRILSEIVEELMSDLDPMRAAINSSLLTALALNTGKYVGGATTKDFLVLKSADFAVVLNGFIQLKQEMKRIGMRGLPILVGEGNLERASMVAEYGCCNLAGQDIGQMQGAGAGFKFYGDVQLGDSTHFNNENAFVGFMPGSMQLMSYNKYVGDYAGPIGTKVRGTLPDPVIPGLVYDISVQPDECNENYDLKVDAYFDLFAAPKTLFKTGDRLNGVNGVVKGVATAS